MSTNMSITTVAELSTLKKLVMEVVELILDRMRLWGEDIKPWDKDKISTTAIRQLLDTFFRLIDQRLIARRRSVSIERTTKGPEDNQSLADQLKGMAKEFAEHTDRMMTERDKSEVKKEASEMTIRKYELKAKQLTQKYEQTRQQLEQMKGELERANQKLGDTERQLSEEHQGQERVRRECQEWDKKWKEIENELNHHRGQNETNQHELKTLKQRADYFEKMLKEKIQANNELEQQLSNQWDEAYKERKVLEEKYKEMCAKYRQLENTKVGMCQSLELSNRRQEKISEKLTFEEAQSRQLQEDIEQAKQQIVLLAEKLDEATVENENLKCQVAIEVAKATGGKQMEVKDGPPTTGTSKDRRPFYGVVEQRDLTDMLIEDLKQTAEHMHQMRSFRRKPDFVSFEKHVDRFMQKIRAMMRPDLGSPYSQRSEKSTKSRQENDESSRSSSPEGSFLGTPPECNEIENKTKPLPMFNCTARIKFCPHAETPHAKQ